ncbi:hypothetical protein [Siphonobacter sp. SORGH_AS_1065]|uniref:hypothetical protein n=1 Tax=Siphonobacter sp. SORGH_AS_1065 TaxID=3041795 RepID=UPI002780C962|nr:hypothetical protein [Siphonobacter sp. SORGH_AS_1065]MDQ1086067.1 hypothetical protein [Siphonobacter sp. SORGH_AS_1065]
MVNVRLSLNGLLLALFLLALMSCSHQAVSPIQGSWRLISYCQPKTDSTCTPMAVPNDKIVLLNLNQKGEFNEEYKNTLPIHYAFLGCGNGTFTLEDSYLLIKAPCMSSLSGKLFKTTFLDNNRLILNPVTDNRTLQTGEFMLERQ